MINKVTLQEQQVLWNFPALNNNVSPYNSSDENSTSGQSVDDDSTLNLGVYDVLCGRHKASFNNIGNRRFRVTVSLSLSRYMSAPSRKDKTVVIKSVAALIQSNGGRFLQRTRGAWVDLNEKQAHEKVGHALRDMAMASAKAESCTSARPQAFSQAEMASTYQPSVSTETIAAHKAASDGADEPVVRDMEATAVEWTFGPSTANQQFSNNDETLFLDDHSLAPGLEDTVAETTNTQQVDAEHDDPTQWLPRDTYRDSTEADVLAWIVQESRLCFDDYAEL